MKILVPLFSTVTVFVVPAVFPDIPGVSDTALMILFAGVLWGILAWLSIWAASRVNRIVWIVSGLLVLVGLLAPTSLLMADREPGPVSSWLSAMLFLLPSIALINAAFLLYSGLDLYAAADRNVEDVRQRQLVRVSLVLGIVLILKVLHNLDELTRWDSTYDPLGYLWLFVPISAVLLSTIMLSTSLPQNMKPAAIAYLLFVPLLMFTVSAQAQRVDFRLETAERAGRIVHAIESYHGDKGQYPVSLSELTPRYMLALPRPMVIYGQNWCYDSGADYYRLGYVDREHWSDPRLIGRIHAMQGEGSGPSRMCEEEVNAIQGRDPGYPYSYWMESE